ncbi:Uncharacterised protein [uncultured archaeon]|nr:Uncharacterised protein [uncultured archaeon]
MTQRYVRRIIIFEVEAPKRPNVEEEIKWLCRCLGLDPDKDRLAFEIFLHLLAANRKGDGVKTIDITKNSNVTQAAVVYHMNLFMRSGLVVKRGAKYFLRGATLGETIAQMEADVMRRMDMLKAIGRRIDEQMI